MIYGIFCKPEYWNTWPLVLKEELAGFATVEIVYPAQVRTIPEGMNSIASPSGNYSVTFNLDDINDDDVYVYVVSDGGYLCICGMFFDGDRNIQFINWQRANKKIFHEMHKRTTSILNKMDIDYKQPEK